MTNNKNDERILDLQEKIKRKKEELGEHKSIKPITNCNLELNGIKHNIHLLNKEQLLHLLVQLNFYKMSAEDLDVLDKYKIRGFCVKDWIKDIQSKLNNIYHEQEVIKLEVLEKQLNKLLSEDKKVELELDDIEEYLKN